MRFNYQARTKTGEIQSGIVEASAKEGAFDILKARGVYVTALEEIVTPIYAKKLKIFEKIKNKEIVAFSRQLAIMFKSRVPLIETFQTLAKQTKNTSLREKIFRISEEMEGGTSLSSALSLYPKIFSPFYINMVKSGEASGKLTDVFLYLADYLEKEYNFRSKIKGAMIYPAFIIVVFLIVSSIIITFVIPQLTAVLKETGQQLPFITRIVMNLADWLKKWGWIFLLIFVFLIIFIYYYSKTETGKKFFDQTLLKIPILGSFLKKLYLSRFALNLSTLISGGLPIIQALEITGEVVGNNVYKNIILQAREGVRKGENISAILEQHQKYVSPLFYQMVVVGEKTGSLDSSLNNVVEFYEGDVDRALDQFIKLLEPILIVLLGGVVGGLMASVIMPIYTMGI